MKRFLLKNNKVIITISLLALVVFTFVAILPKGSSVVNAEGTDLSNLVYKSDLSEIDNTTKSSIVYKPISELYDVVGSYPTAKTNVTAQSNVKYLISNAYELYAFSCIVKDNTTLGSKGFYYQLSADIDYLDSRAQEYYFHPVKDFGATFDGNGFEIIGLQMVTLDEAYVASRGLIYYSMFSTVSTDGVICNVGLVNNIISARGTIGDCESTAPLAGSNYGKIYNVYVQDLRGDAAGIATFGFNIAGLVCESHNVLVNSYVAYSRIPAVTDFQQETPIMLQEAEGTFENVYFYDARVTNIDYNFIYYALEEPLPISALHGALFITRAELQNPGTQTGNRFVSNYNNTTLGISSKWYTKYSYSQTHQSYIVTDYPILRGLEEYKADSSGLNGAFVINNANDYAYMVRLTKSRVHFRAREVTYALNNDIYLDEINYTEYEMGNYEFLSTLTSFENAVPSIKLVNGKVSNSYNSSDKAYYTIYDAKIVNGKAYSGYQSYGLIPVLAGKVENINISDITYGFANIADTSSLGDIKVVGAVTGYLKGGSILNVNIKTNIDLSNDRAIGIFYCGGIAGFSDSGTINTVTTSGSINGGTQIYNSVTTHTSIGGVLGYSNTVSSINKCFNAMDITAPSYSASARSITQYLGGVIGSGSTKSCTQLENKGNITIGELNGANSTNGCGKVYAAGIIGAHFNASETIGDFLNQGNITYYYNNLYSDFGYTTTNFNYQYLSGVINVAVLDGNKTDSNNNVREFSYVSLTNNGDINIDISKSQSQFLYRECDYLFMNVSGVVFVDTTKCNFDGVYNLNYKYNYDATRTKSSKLASAKVEMAIVREYAPCIVSNGTNLASHQITCKTVYNYRDYDFISSKNLSFNNVLYSGCLSGQFMQIRDARNEGNLNFNITTNATRPLDFNTGSSALNNVASVNDLDGQSISRAMSYDASFSTNKYFRIVGVFEEVSIDCSAKNVLNTGNITFNITSASSQVYYQLFVAGICYANRTPSEYSSDGKGNIAVGNYNSNFDVYNPLKDNFDSKAEGTLHNVINSGDILISNYAVDNGIINGNNGLLCGVSRSAGILLFNNFVVSSAANTGNVDSNNQIITKGGDYTFNESGDYEVETGGICWTMNGLYAQFKDCVNDGIIKAINYSTTSAWVNAGGICSRNEKLENLETYHDDDGGINAPHQQQMILFSINYGDVYAYNDVFSSGVDSEEQSKAAGILCLGLCNVINTVNYGSIYATQVSSGIFGLVDFGGKFTSKTNENYPIYLANLINYGNVYLFANNSYNITGSNGRKYSTLQNAIDNKTIVTASTSEDSGNRYKRTGGIIGSVAFGTSTNAQYIYFRYLINFNENVKVIGKQKGTTTNASIDTSTLVSTNSAVETIGSNTVIYASLSSKIESGGSIGVFNENFMLRKAINGEFMPSTGNKNACDKFISDYLQYVGYSKVNESLINRVGWLSIAYSKAVDNFASSFKSLYTVITKTNSASVIDSNYQIAIVNGSSISSKNEQILQDSLKEIINQADADSLKALFGHIASTNYTTIKVEDLLDYVFASNLTVSELRNILDGAMYNDVLLDILSSNNEAHNVIQNIIESLSQTQIENILVSYLDALNGTDTTFTDLFNNDISLQMREQVVNSLISNLTNAELTEIYNALVASGMISEDKIEYVTDTTLLSTYLSNTILKDISQTSTVISSLDGVSQNTIKNDLIEQNAKLVINQATGQNLSTGNYSDTDYINLWNYIKSNNYSDAFKIVIEDTIMASSTYTKPGYITYKENRIANDDTKVIYMLATNTNYSYSTNSVLSSLGSNTLGGNDASSSNNNIRAYIQYQGDSGTYFYGPYLSNTGNRYGATLSTNRDGQQFSTGYNEMGFFTDESHGTQAAGTFSTNWVGRETYYISNSGTVISNPALYYSNYYTTGVYFYSTNSGSTPLIYFRDRRTIGNNFTAHQNSQYIDYTSSDIVNMTISTGGTTGEYTDYTSTLANIKQVIDGVGYSNIAKMFTEDKTAANISEFVGLSITSTYLLNSSNLSQLQQLSKGTVALYPTISVSVNGTTYTYKSYAAYLASGISDIDIVKGFDFYSSKEKFNVLVSYLNSNSLLTEEQKKQLISLLYADKNTYAEVFNLLNKNDLKVVSAFYEFILEAAMSANKDLISSLLQELQAQTNSSSWIDSETITFEYNGTTYTYNRNDYKDIIAALGLYYNYSVSSSFASSNLYTLLANLGYTFHDSNGNVIQEVFDQAIADLGLNMSDYIDDIGIFALSSSEGILNGNFLPDNINLAMFDVELDGEASSDWRGGTTENPNLATDPNSVNYSFFVSMKQLKKSIATNIFDIELVSKDGNYTLTTTSDEIDLTNGIITFYIANNADEILGNSFRVNVTNGSYTLSYGASFTGDNNLILVPANIGDQTFGYIDVQAEDESVVRRYTIMIERTEDKKTEFSSVGIINNSTLSNATDINSSPEIFEISSSNAISPTGGGLRVALTTDNLPNQSILQDALKLYDASGNLVNSYFTFDQTFANNGVVIVSDISQGIYSAGTLNYQILFPESMPSGEYNLFIELSSSSRLEVIFTKEACDLCDLISLEYEGIIYTPNNNNAMTTDIKVGEILTEEMLQGEYYEFLLTSPLVTVVQNVTCTQQANNGLLEYVVEFIITAENGTSVKRYTHTLREVEDASIKNVYKNGTNVTSANNVHSYEFGREEEPTYSVELNYESLNYTDDNLSFYRVDSNPFPDAYIDSTGFTVSFYSSDRPITYSFVVRYEITFTYSNNRTITRIFDFGLVEITKSPSHDSRLNGITFVSESASDALLTYASSKRLVYGDGDNTNSINYETYSNLGTSGSGIAGINYKDVTVYVSADYGSGTFAYNDAVSNVNSFYVLGVVSETNIESFTPVFSLPTAASIYRAFIDASGNKFLYAIFQDSTDETSTKVFLVSEDWKNVYDVDNTTTPIATSNDTITAFAQNGVNYLLNEYTGTTSTSNITLATNFAGDLIDEFYYVPYIVYAEDGVNSTLYNISVRDITNTIRISLNFDFLAGTTYSRDDIYATITCFEYNEGVIGSVVSSMSMIVNKDADGNYIPEYSFSAIKYGYYKIVLSLPSGYEYTVYAVNTNKPEDEKKNQLTNPEFDEYVPPYSMFTQSITFNITISGSSSPVWGESGTIILE